MQVGRIYITVHYDIQAIVSTLELNNYCILLKNLICKKGHCSLHLLIATLYYYIVSSDLSAFKETVSCYHLSDIYSVWLCFTALCRS